MIRLGIMVFALVAFAASSHAMPLRPKIFSKPACEVTFDMKERYIADIGIIEDPESIQEFIVANGHLFKNPKIIKILCKRG